MLSINVPSLVVGFPVGMAFIVLLQDWSSLGLLNAWQFRKLVALRNSPHVPASVLNQNIEWSAFKLLVVVAKVGLAESVHHLATDHVTISVHEPAHVDGVT